MFTKCCACPTESVIYYNCHLLQEESQEPELEVFTGWSQMTIDLGQQQVAVNISSSDKAMGYLHVCFQSASILASGKAQSHPSGS